MLPGVPERGRPLATATTLVLASCLGASPAPAQHWHALPVAAGTDAVAAAAGLEPGLPPWRVLFEATRRRELWGKETGRAGLAGTAGGPAGEGASGASVPLPLAPSVWRRLLGKHDLPDDRLQREERVRLHHRERPAGLRSWIKGVFGR